MAESFVMSAAILLLALKTMFWKYFVMFMV
nr:hypothetical protein Iba_chr03aCG12830 [Ipomoea batatas]